MLSSLISLCNLNSYTISLTFLIVWYIFLPYFYCVVIRRRYKTSSRFIKRCCPNCAGMGFWNKQVVTILYHMGRILVNSLNVQPEEVTCTLTLTSKSLFRAKNSYRALLVVQRFTCGLIQWHFRYWRVVCGLQAEYHIT